MNLSTSMNVFFDRDNTTAPESLRRLCAAGYKYVDMNFWDWNYKGSRFCGDEWGAWVNEIAEAAELYNIRFNQAHAPVTNFFSGTLENEFTIEMCRRTLYASKTLGIPWVVFHASSRDGEFDGAHIKKLRDDNIGYFREMLVTAEKNDVGIAIENMRDNFSGENIKRVYTSLPEELIELTDCLNHPLAGVCWDTGHANIQRISQYDSIQMLGSRLKCLHVQDNDGISDFHVLPFYGNIDWKTLVGALKNIDYKGDFTYEAHNSVRIFPDNLKDESLKLSVKIGKYIIGNYFR